MPEIVEAGYDMPSYGNYFLTNIANSRPSSTKVVALEVDYLDGERKAMLSRGKRVVKFAKTWSHQNFLKNLHDPWVQDLYILALAVPDTHGLLITPCLECLPSAIQAQLCRNYPNWVSFRDALSNLTATSQTSPISLSSHFLVPLPWHQNLTPDVPYSIGTEPSNSGLVIQLNRFMPSIWRGSNPDPAVNNKTGRAYIDDSEQLFCTSRLKQDPRLDVSQPVREMDTDHEDPPEREEFIFSNPTLFLAKNKNKIIKGTGDSDDDSDSDSGNLDSDDSYLDSQITSKDSSIIRFHQYIWPKKLLRDLFMNHNYTAQEAFNASEMRLVGFIYHVRKIIVDLNCCTLEVHLQLHTSLQIYSTRQWERVRQVPQDYRGFKVGLALVMAEYVLVFPSFNNNLRLVWRTQKKAKLLKEVRVPDPVLDYFGWCTWGAKWLRYYAPRSRTSTTIYQWLANPGATHHMQALGSYMTDEALARAGIPPNIPAYDVLNNPILTMLLTDIVPQMLIERVYREMFVLARTY
ncbi:hypothetical protein C8F04DRAFT_1317278 [Mycena alexandri]|uniref:Uncharacterized protein n=1 Tax=Mycena alexandri TaxID=1745969 RepID=A0AAD6T478_9AGAR|nr:hypothetical protein C8F04DRAFT_1317278 [Mycena alexandri]